MFIIASLQYFERPFITMGKRKIKLHSALSQAQKQQRQRKRQKLEEESEKQAQAGPSRPNQEAQRPWIPFDKAQHILLVGEGNFSFAASLARHACQGIGKKLVASAYDSEAIAREKYPDLQEHLDVVRPVFEEFFPCLTLR